MLCLQYTPIWYIVNYKKNTSRLSFLAQIVSVFICRFSNIQSLYGAGEGNRTLASSLGSWRSTIELHPQKLSKEYYNANPDKDQVIDLLARVFPFT